MRKMSLATLAALGVVWSAPALASAEVRVAVAPDLQAKAEHKYGVRDVDRLAASLRRSVERELGRTGAYDGARLELTLVDVKPNRPTFKELGDRPGLSFQSFGLGGAQIEGRAIGPDGSVTPLSYRWYESDIRQAAHASTWSDAERTINQFAYRLGRGQVLAER
ncbi:hypothetical protein [Phenylobacterium sp.]|uniref:hypothetical protein n=1 Tax=Phenylobacterium sp. TaxID=1871053 RepID=UPI0027332F04|nr:hypothetical protein [Phenylobacterium sp.]MDP3659707.1 hypothetical protein [Phenylobacterium sp.]